MKQYMLLACLLFIGFSGQSQTKESALRDAKATAQATVNGDYLTVVKHTYPPIVEFMGGEATAVKVIGETLTAMKSQGIVFKSATIGSVSVIVKEQDQYRCFIQNTNIITMPGQEVTSKSYLLGIYDETKEIWYFLEAEKLKNPLLINQIMPGFETSMEIPKDEISTKPTS